MDTQIINTLITLAISTLGGIIGAFINYLLTKKKTDVEVKKLEAEIEKLKAETKKTLVEAEKISNDTKHTLSEVNYFSATEVNETILYDGTKGINWSDINSEFGRYNIVNGVVLIQNTDWMSFYLQTYEYDGKEYGFVPKNELISGNRKFHVSCDLKVIDTSYDIFISICEEPEPQDGRDPVIDQTRISINKNEWNKTDCYFRVPPDKNFKVEIGAEFISGEGSLQVRNLLVAERVN